MLGHTAKSSLKKPRQLLSMSAPDELAEEGSTDAETKTLGSDGARFTGQRWSIRGAIEDGMAAILDIGDVARRATARDVAHMERNALVMKHASAVKALGNSLGIVSAVGAHPFVVQEDHLLRIIHVTKGKKLFLRALPLIAPPQRDAVLPIVIKHLLRFVCSAEYSVAGEQLDDRVSAALAECINGSPDVPLYVLSQCVDFMVDVHTAETLPVVLQHKQSAVVIEALLTTGETFNAEGRAGGVEWSAAFDKLKMLVAAPVE